MILERIRAALEVVDWAEHLHSLINGGSAQEGILWNADASLEERYGTFCGLSDALYRYADAATRDPLDSFVALPPPTSTTGSNME